MNVCMITYSFYESDTRVMQYANALVKRGDTVDILSLGRPGQAKFEIINGVNVYRIQTRIVNERGRFAYLYRILRFLASSGAALTRKHLAKRYQLVHVHSVPDFLVFAAIVPRVMGTPVILDIHDVLPEMYADKFKIKQDSLLFKLLLLTEKWSIGFSSHTIIANHVWHERLIARATRAEKCTPIRNFPDPRLFHPYRSERNDGKFLILYPGTLNWYQGVDTAIKAFARVADQISQAEFHIYGEGPAKTALMELAGSLGLSSRVVFHNFLPADQIASVMADADLAVEPKQARSSFANEAASTKILEFMAVHVPVIASRTRIHAYYFDESLVKFFEADNDAELAECILLLQRDERLRKQLVSNAIKYVESNNWDVRKREYLDLVDWLVDPARPRRVTPAATSAAEQSTDSSVVCSSRMVE